MAWLLVAAGAVLGFGIGVEYTQVIVAGLIGLYCLGAHRLRAGFVALGGLVSLVPLLVINARLFGGPFTTAYQGHLPNFEGSGAFGVYNLVTPQPRELR